MFPWIFSQFFLNTGAASKRCSIKAVVSQNDLIKYSSSAPGVKSRKALWANLLKIALPVIFQKIWLQVQKGDIEKYISMAISEDIYFLRKFLNGCYSNATEKIMVKHVLYFLTWRHVKERTNMYVTLKKNEHLLIVFSVSASRKNKHTKLFKL